MNRTWMHKRQDTNWGGDVHTHSHIHRNTVGQQIHSERSALFAIGITH